MSSGSDELAHEAGSEHVSDDLWTSLFRFRNRLQASRPHAVHASHNEPLFVFTDACYEPGAEWCSGMGATVFDAAGPSLHFSRCMWTQRAGEHWKKASKKTIIFGLEFLAVLTALVQWKEILRIIGRPCILIITLFVTLPSRAAVGTRRRRHWQRTFLRLKTQEM